MTACEKAAILVEALPYIKEFYGKTVVIKYGGSAMTDCSLKKAVMEDIVLMKYVGMHPVVVHGGGPDITRMLERLGITTSFVNGLRVTDEATMEIVEMVLVGKINKEIVAGINDSGGLAVGLSGKDGRLIRAEPIPGKEMLGMVGQVREINTELIETLTERGYIPVISPVGIGDRGESYNINADHVAGAIASALKADKLVLLTDVPGILADKSDPASRISRLRVSEVDAYIDCGIIQGGMIPKVECCVEALRGGVGRTHIIDGRVPHAILLEVFTDEGIGSMVVKG
ncbi:MAG TPA: acetylglutamate kinase [Syntrophothermus lipocalidus]|nr:acetylglutamate kinase [Syntrophothermus lipocalidus]